MAMDALSFDVFRVDPEDRLPLEGALEFDEATIRELQALGWDSGDTALNRSICESAECFRVVVYNVPAPTPRTLAYAGVVDKGRGNSLVWMLYDKRFPLYAHPREVVREAREFIRLWVALYGDLFNVIHRSNRRALKFVDLCGANFHAVPPCFAEGRGEEFVAFRFSPLNKRK